LLLLVLSNRRQLEGRDDDRTMMMILGSVTRENGQETNKKDSTQGTLPSKGDDSLMCCHCGKKDVDRSKNDELFVFFDRVAKLPQAGCRTTCQVVICFTVSLFCLLLVHLS
jgi:hypothetical protein